MVAILGLDLRALNSEASALVIYTTRFCHLRTRPLHHFLELFCKCHVLSPELESMLAGSLNECIMDGISFLAPLQNYTIDLWSSFNR